MPELFSRHKLYQFQCKPQGGIVIRQLWNTRFAKEILLILLVKVMLIFAIWWVFFRTSETPSAEQVSHALLASGPVINQGVIANDQH